MASNIEVASYDPKKVNLVMNGKIITGFASDSMITIARNEDTVTTQVGVKGDVAYNENANESGTITVTLMGTSSSLPYVRSLALKRKEVSVMIVDANDSASVNVAEDAAASSNRLTSPAQRRSVLNRSVSLCRL